MKRILRCASALTILLAIGVSGCGDSGDIGSGVPKDVGYVPPKAPTGSPDVTVDMSKIGNRPKRAPGDGAAPK
jgi:hypothetical protein